MKTSRIFTGLSAGVLLALAGGAQAAVDTVTFQVTANVIAFCDIDATDMAFGDFDGTADVLATSVISVECTNGHAYQVELDAGSTAGSTIANRTMTNGTSTLNYTLYRDAARTLNWGDTAGDDVDGIGAGVTTAVNHTVYGELPALSNENVTTGAYSSTITVTVNF
jgi:spore coat protein U-like protein